MKRQNVLQDSLLIQHSLAFRLLRSDEKLEQVGAILKLYHSEIDSLGAKCRYRFQVIEELVGYLRGLPDIDALQNDNQTLKERIEQCEYAHLEVEDLRQLVESLSEKVNSCVPVSEYEALSHAYQSLKIKCNDLETCAQENQKYLQEIRESPFKYIPGNDQNVGELSRQYATALTEIQRLKAKQMQNESTQVYLRNLLLERKCHERNIFSANKRV